MKLIVASLLAGSAVAFVPSSPAARGFALREAETVVEEAVEVEEPVAPPAPKKAGKVKAATPWENELGAQKPLGYFDPLGMCTGDCSKEKFDGMREYEIVHGRVAMLAVVGYLTTANGIRFPGAEEIPDGLRAFDALGATPEGQNVLIQMLFTILAATIVNRDADWTDATPEFVGDYRNGALDFGWDKLSEDAKLKKRAVELNNGRAAMMGIFGLVAHEGLQFSILPGGYLPGQA